MEFDAAELARQLAPTLRVNIIRDEDSSTDYGQRLVNECRTALSAVLPFMEAEREFLDLLLDKGEINPTLLTDDTELQARIQEQPLLEWKALNVRRHKGLSVND